MLTAANHPAALAALNTRAGELCKLLQPLPAPGPSIQPPGAASELHIRHHIVVDGEEVRRSGPVTSRDFADRLCGVEVHGAGLHEQLPRDDVKSLVRLAELTLKSAKGLSSVANYAYVETTLCRWLEAHRTNATTDDWIQFLETCLAADVAKRRVAIPLFGFQVPKAVRVGPHQIGSLSKLHLDGMVGRIPESAPFRGDLEDRWRGTYQGHPYVVYDLQGVSSYCVEVAIDNAERLVAILRFFHPAAMIPQAPCLIGRRGQVLVREFQHFEFVGEMPDPPSGGFDTGVAFGQHFVINPESWNQLARLGIGRIFHLGESETRNEMQEIIWSAIKTYARGVTTIEPAERLLHAFAAAESVLLIDKEAEIQEKVGRRVAFLTRQTPDDRLDTLRSIKEAYGVRSRFAHSGRTASPEEFAVVEVALTGIWLALHKLALTMPFATKKELVSDFIRQELT